MRETLLDDIKKYSWYHTIKVADGVYTNSILGISA